MHLRGGSALNRLLNRTAEGVFRDVDVVLLVIQAMVWTDEDEAALNALRNLGQKVILVVNKIDLVAARYDFTAVIFVSARKNENIGQIEQWVLEMLPEGPSFFPEDQITDRSERFLAGELLREQLTRRYSDELPYALTVEIERFEETERLYRIGAVVWVERPGQKAILIGRKGEAMKETSRLARENMERLFQRKVWLDVWVKVKKSWSSDERALASFGYLE